MKNFLERRTFTTLEEVQAALVEPFPNDVIKYRKNYPYIPVEFIKQRLISVLGVDGYDVFYTNTQKHEEDWITCDCTIKVDFTRWGGRIKEITQSDGIQVARLKAGASIVDMGNSYKSVRSSSFAKAAQELGVGLYLQFLDQNQLPTNNQNNNNNNGNQKGNGNNAASDKQKKAVYAMEQKIKLSNDTKQKLISRLFNHQAETFVKSPTFKNMNTYIQTLKPVCDIIDEIGRASNNPREVAENQSYIFGQLSRHFQQQINSYTGLLTIATADTVDFTKNLLRRTA